MFCRTFFRAFLLALLFSIANSHTVFASTGINQVNSADTVWVLMCSAMVMIMTPGLALFYGGMVRSKNVLGTIIQSFLAIGLVSILWVLYGYSLSFGPDKFGFIGGLDFVGLNGVGFSPSNYAPTIPHSAFMIFQMMFAVITPALITGAFAERFKFSTYMVFLILWITLVYTPLAHWVWGGGWIGAKLGALDFAGGLVVHISSGAAALAAALVVGKRTNHAGSEMNPHNLILTALGAALLWFGWFGFNAGSALAMNSLAVNAFVVTHVASATGVFMWVLIEWIHRKKSTLLGAATGAVAGLVAITPAAGFVGVEPSIIIGAVASIICYAAVSLKSKIGYDDSLDAFGVHGVGGTWGAIATGLFASMAINPNGKNGLFFGNPDLLLVQIISVVVAWIFAFGVTFLLLKFLDKTMGLRVTREEEFIGLDLSIHGERGYSLW